MMVSLMAGHFIDFVPSHRGPMAFRGPGVCASDENWASGASRSCARRSWRKIKSSELRVGAR
jgi:hypothetical protein